MTMHVETDVPFGNACEASVRECSDHTEVAFAADPHGGPERLWFCFRLRSDSAGPAAEKPVRLVLLHPDTMLGGDTPAVMRPVVQHADGDWERLGPGTREDLPDGRFVASWSMEPPNPSAEVAFCYPYGRSEIDLLVRETGGYWRADTIGVSQGGRPLVRLSNGDGSTDEGARRAGLFLLARQHSGETGGSWMLDGFLRGLAEAGDDAPLVWAVPLANIDGVENGDYGKDNFPYDLNRAWGAPPMRHEVLAIQRDAARWQARCTPALALDFHSPGGCETTGIYPFVPSPDSDPDGHQLVAPWADALKAALTPTYADQEFSRVASYASRWETPSGAAYFRSAFGIAACTLEVPYSMIGELVLTRAHYREAGRRAAAAVLSRLADET